MPRKVRDKECPVCTKTYVSMNAAQRHLRERHPDYTEPLVILSPQGPAVPSTITPVPVQPKPKVCHHCSGLPAFVDMHALSKHIIETHYYQCPKCSVNLLATSLARHLELAHGITDAVVEAANQAVLDSISNRAAAESSHATSKFLTPGGLDEPSCGANVPPRDSQGSVISGIYNMSRERFYCEDYDCGRGFSTKAQLESHTRFFHPKDPTHIVEGEKEVVTPSDDPPEAAQRSAEHSPASTTSSPLPEKGATRGGLEPPDLVESFLGPPTVIQGGADVPPAVTASTPLSLQCRVCGASPTVGTRPTVTMCGHLFCSECITQHVMSTSRCPVCNNALMLYCLFKLDLPASS